LENVNKEFVKKYNFYEHKICDVFCPIYSSNTTHTYARTQNFSLMGADSEASYILCLKFAAAFICMQIYLELQFLSRSLNHKASSSDLVVAAARPPPPPSPQPSLGACLKMYLKKYELEIRLHTLERLWVSVACLHVRTTN
jgi:hypothetical protein